MRKNIGIIDRILRVALAVLVGILFFTGHISGLTAIILSIIGVVLFLTAVFGICPLYFLFNWSTQGKKA
jgi:hypothetical protein